MSLRYLITGGTGTWNSTSNWSATSGGASGASFPINGDDVVFDINSSNALISLNVASVCSSLSATNAYVGTFSGASTLSVAGNLLFGTAMTIVATNNLAGANTNGTWTSNGKIWTGGLSLGGNGYTLTFADNWQFNGNLAFNCTTTSGQIGLSGNQAAFKGNATFLGNAGAMLTGSTLLVFNGTNQSWSNGNANALNTNINCSGTMTINTTVKYQTGTLTLVSGTLSAVGTQTFGTCTLNTSGGTWNNILLVGGSTVTLSSALNVTGTTTLAGSNTFAGTSGFIATNLTGPGAGNTITLNSGLTYTVNGALQLLGTAASPITIKSNSSGNQANLILSNNNTTTQNVDFVTATDINSNGGLTIFNYKGTLSNATNWKAPQTAVMPTIAYTN